MQPCFAGRFHRGGKLFISHGGSLWAGKLAVLLRLHHSRHSRQLASCVKDLPLCGMNKIGWFIKSKHRAGYTRCCSSTKSGCSWRALFGRRHWRCFEGSNTEKTVWGAACTQGVVGSGARTRFGGVFAYVRKHASSRKKRYPILFRNHPGIPDFINFPCLFRLSFSS